MNNGTVQLKDLDETTQQEVKLDELVGVVLPMVKRWNSTDETL